MVPRIRRKLTKTVVDSTKPGPKRVWVWDTEVTGFALCVLPSGRRGYYLKYRTTAGRIRKPKIGSPAELTPKQARRIASEWMQRVRLGDDPSLDRGEQRTAPTVDDLCDRYLAEWAVEPNKKPSSIRMDRVNIERHVRTRLGRLKVDEVSQLDVRRLKKAMAATPGAANRVLSLLSKMFRLAEDWGWRRQYSNPVRGVRRNKEGRRERYLSDAERRRLEVVLAAGATTPRAVKGHIAPSSLAAIRVLHLTGMRVGEVLGLDWSMVDVERGELRLPDSKTGQKVVYAPAPVLEVLHWIAERANGTSGLVFPSRDGRKLQNLRRTWKKICTAAELKDFRMHDLRHDYVSQAIRAGCPLEVVGQLVGHKSAATTRRYAHLSQHGGRDAAAKVAAFIQEAS